MAGRLGDDALFAFRPEDDKIIEDYEFDPELVKSASNSDLLTCTYNMLRNPQTSKAEALTLWELRLALLLFENRLPSAKREAVSLNNALYLLENPDAASAASTVPRPAVPRADSLVARRPGSPGVLSTVGTIYPLPKNNDGAIGFPLLSLILRLKSSPNLSLVNELYKLCYQLRLKGHRDEEAEIQKNLISLSYEIIMVLTISRNYYTLLSFLRSLEADLKADSDRSDKIDPHYASNVSLMIVLANVLILQSGEPSRLDVPELRKRFETLDAFTMDCFTNVLRTYSPMVSDTAEPPLSEDEDVTYDKLVEIVKAAKLTGRITCCTLASFELGNMLDARFEEIDQRKRLVAKVEGFDNEKLESLYVQVTSQWGSFIHKVYGIE